MQNVSHALHANERKERANKLGAARVRRLLGVARKCWWWWWWWQRLAAAVRQCARSGWRCQTAVLPFLCYVFFPVFLLLPISVSCSYVSSSSFFFLFDDGLKWSCCGGDGEEQKWQSRGAIVVTTSAAVFLLHSVAVGGGRWQLPCYSSFFSAKISAGSPVAAAVLLILLMCKDISPYVFSFVVFFCFPSLFGYVSSLYHRSFPLFSLQKKKFPLFIHPLPVFTPFSSPISLQEKKNPL